MSEPTLGMTWDHHVEIRFPDGRVEPTRLCAYQYFGGDPPMVDAVEIRYFDVATLVRVDGLLWIEVEGGTTGLGARAARANGWYAADPTGRYTLREPPWGPREILHRVEARMRR